MTELLALMTIMAWPVIPLFWIPVHIATGFFRRLGLITYAMPLFTWLPLAYLIYLNKPLLLRHTTELPLILNIAGVPLFVCGTLVHIWTARLLGLWGIIGVPEVSALAKEDLVSTGPFSVVRHPTYLAHTLIFLGAFLITESTVVGLITLLDLLIVNIVIIPLEEKELFHRFGSRYGSYKKKVPSAIFPGIRGR